MIKRFSEDYLEGVTDTCLRINDLTIKLGSKQIGLLDFAVLVSEEMVKIAGEVQLAREIITAKKKCESDAG